LVSWLRVTVVVDNDPGDGLLGEWGLSMLAEAPSWTCLFDADTNPSVSAHNLRALGVDLSRVDFAVLSHHHYDHSGGFSYVGEARPGLTVYAPPGPLSELEGCGLRPVEVRETREVAEGAYVVGPLEAWGGFYEVALAVEVDGLGLVLLVGCSHPGVDRIAEAASSELGRKVHAVIGGFHKPPASALDRLAELADLIMPAHCTGGEAEGYVARRYPEKYAGVRSGSRFEFRAP